MKRLFTIASLLLMSAAYAGFYAVAAHDTRLPQLPVGMTVPQQRADYILMHIWDFPENLSSDDSAEQALADFLSVAGVASHEAYCMAVDTLMAKAKVADINILSLAAKYTADPVAPFYDDELYLPFVDAALASGNALKDPVMKERLEYDRKCLLKNRVGTTATDFTLELPGGVTGSLRGLPKASKTLMVLFDPECDHCRDTLSALSQSSALASAVEAGDVSVLLVWIDAQDSPSSLSVPAADGWIIASDRTGLMDNELYEFPAMPVIYILDSQDTVIAKNIRSVQQVLAALGLE